MRPSSTSPRPNTKRPGETFAGAEAQACAETPAEIGEGARTRSRPCRSHRPSTQTPYRFRLLATNQYGTGEGEAGASPSAPRRSKPAAPCPVLYTEATLRATLDPSGSPTTYRFEYGIQEADTARALRGRIGDGEGPSPSRRRSPASAKGTDLPLPRSRRELRRERRKSRPDLRPRFSAPPAECCPNAEYRTGLSATLPDCRAYELVTPAETKGATLGAPEPGSSELGFNNWLTVPRGPAAGEALTFGSSTTLPGFEGLGGTDAYRARRAPGSHPAEGWTSEIVSTSFSQGLAIPRDGSPDQLYYFWRIEDLELGLEGALPTATYLGTPAGFELAGRGSLGIDPEAVGDYVSAGGTHVIFSSKAHLEPQAPGPKRRAPPSTIAPLAAR